MIKTQIQLPDRLYQEAKRVAREREFSLAEVVRRGVEYVTRVYPPLGTGDRSGWQMPPPVRAGVRRGVSLERLRDLAIGDEEPRLAKHQRNDRKGAEK